MENEKSRSMIFGEYLRNVCYGRKGGIEPPENEVEGLEEYVSYYYNLAYKKGIPKCRYTFSPIIFLLTHYVIDQDNL